MSLQSKIALTARPLAQGCWARRPAASPRQALRPLAAQPPHKSHLGFHESFGGAHQHHLHVEEEECYYDSDFESPVLSHDASSCMKSHPPPSHGNPGIYCMYEAEVGDVLEKMVNERWHAEDSLPSA